MARYPNLWKRGNRYYLRMRVPADLASVEKREHIAISLRTSDFQEAVSKYREAQWRLEQDFAVARELLVERDWVKAALADGHLERLSEANLERVAQEWFDARDGLRRRETPREPGELQEALDLLEQDRDELEVIDPEVADVVRRATDQLLVRAGFPARGRRIAGRELGPKPHGVDRAGVQYRYLAGLVRRAIEAEMLLKKGASRASCVLPTSSRA